MEGHLYCIHYRKGRYYPERETITMRLELSVRVTTLAAFVQKGNDKWK
jgi:hypothetical protein